MQRCAILLVLASCAHEAPAPVVASEPTKTEKTEPCPEPNLAPIIEATAPRYETRIIGTATTGPKYVGRPIDLDVKDADIGNVCRLLADVGHVNIVLGDGVQGSVTLSMKRVPWDQVFDAVIEAKGFRAEREGNVILVFAK